MAAKKGKLQGKAMRQKKRQAQHLMPDGTMMPGATHPGMKAKPKRRK